MSKARHYKEGHTTIWLAFSPINQGWLVWREDNGHQAHVRTFGMYDEAVENYVNRVAFLKEVTA
jgi:hypothetical protein